MRIAEARDNSAKGISLNDYPTAYLPPGEDPGPSPQGYRENTNRKTPGMTGRIPDSIRASNYHPRLSMVIGIQSICFGKLRGPCHCLPPQRCARASVTVAWQVSDLRDYLPQAESQGWLRLELFSLLRLRGPRSCHWVSRGRNSLEFR
jgi:hypothetical protein